MESLVPSPKLFDKRVLFPRCYLADVSSSPVPWTVPRSVYKRPKIKQFCPTASTCDLGYTNTGFWCKRRSNWPLTEQWREPELGLLSELLFSRHTTGSRHNSVISKIVHFSEISVLGSQVQLMRRWVGCSLVLFVVCLQQYSMWFNADCTVNKMMEEMSLKCICRVVLMIYSRSAWAKLLKNWILMVFTSWSR